VIIAKPLGKISFFIAESQVICFRLLCVQKPIGIIFMKLKIFHIFFSLKKIPQTTKSSPEKL